MNLSDDAWLSINAVPHERRNFKDLNVVFTGYFVWGGEAIL